MSKAEFCVEPFVNELGQTINPGDQVIYVGTSWGSTRVGRGVYEGVYYRTRDRYFYNRETKKTEVARGKRAIDAVRVGGIPHKRAVWNNGAGYKSGQENKLEYVDAFRKAILPLKRVYKVETTLAEANGI